MSDFLSSDFTSSFRSSTVDDDDDDFERAASAFPDISLDGTTDLPSIPSSYATGRTNSGFSFEEFDATPPAQSKETSIKVTGDDEIDQFESNFPDIDVPVQSSYTAPTFAPQPQFSATPILTQTIEEEPQVIRDWREKQQVEIKARDEASKAVREETIDKAERAIEEFYENYAKKKERSIRDNKNSEAEYVAELQASLSTGTTWERICNLIDLQNSQSKTNARTGSGTTDLSRYREVLLRLRREKEAAPGAAGY